MKDNTCKLTRWQVLQQQLNNLKPADFLAAIQRREDITILDVRTNEEYLSVQLFPGALHLSYLDYGFLDQLEALDKEKFYFVYCRTGRRSVRTCMLLKNSGFKNVFNLDGGMVAWEQHFGKSVLEPDRKTHP